MALRVLSAAAVAAAAAFGILLGIRTIITPDLGYHLAYGEQFLQTHRPVDTNAFIYTLGGPDEADRAAPGPGCWYDADGQYRFANANWLTQVIMAAAYSAGGEAALSLLQAGLVAGIILLSLRTMRRLCIPPVLRAAGVILIAMAAQERFNLRPELFSFLLLAAQLSVLAGGRFGRRGAAALVGLQLLAVNLHSYFLLGLALTGAVLAERFARMLWLGLRGCGDEEQAARVRREAGLLGAVLLAQAAVCLINPWTWRLAVLPLETLVFMRKHNVASGDLAAAGHPWSHIGEFYRPFATAFMEVKSTWAYRVLLAAAGVGGLAAALKRRWAWLFIIAGMAVVSLSMRRNIAPAAILLTPPALAAICLCLARWRASVRPEISRRVAAVAAGVVLAAAAYLSFSVVTQRYYYADHSTWRFGLGISRLLVPLDAAEWISTRPPAERLWTGYTSSSNLYYFTHPHRDVPILTNTWAYPPRVMRRVLDYCSTQRPFTDAEKVFAPQIVAVRVDRTSAPLARALAKNPRWALVHLDAMHAVFLRADGANAALAALLAITPETLDLAAYKAAATATDPVAPYATCMGGMTLYRLGWDAPAIDVLSRTVELDADYYQAWDLLGLALARRGTRRLARRDHRGRKDWLRALECFQKALRIEPGYKDARDHRELVIRQIAELKRGVLLKPVFP